MKFCSKQLKYSSKRVSKTTALSVETVEKGEK